MLKSCAFTASYKGCFIHQHTDGRFSWLSQDHRSHPAKTWAGAQRAITRHLAARS